MKRNSLLFVLVVMFVVTIACRISPDAQVPQTVEATATNTPASTPTITASPTIPSTPTATPIPTFTPTPEGALTGENATGIQEIRHIGDGAIYSLLYSPDGLSLAAATSSGVHIYETATYKEIWSASTHANIKQIAYTKDGSILTGVDLNMQIYRWQANDGKELLSKRPEGISELPMAFALSPTGDVVAAPGFDDVMHIYSTADATQLAEIPQEKSLASMIYKMAISADGKKVVGVNFKGKIMIWDIPTQKAVGEIEDEKYYPQELMIGSNGQVAVHVTTRTEKHHTRVLDLASKKWKQTLELEVFSVTAGKYMLSRVEDGLALRKFGNEQIFTTLPEKEASLDAATVSPDGKNLAVGTRRGIHIWNIEEATLLGNTSGLYTNYTSMALAGNGEWIAAGHELGIDILMRADGSLITQIKTAGPVQVVASAPNGELVAGFAGKEIMVWKVNTGEMLWHKETDDEVDAMVFSPDGALIATSYNQRTDKMFALIKARLSLWKSESGDLTEDWQGGEGLFSSGYTSLAFSTDGKYIVGGLGSGDIEIWNLETKKIEKEVNIDDELAWSPVVAVSPDNLEFASGGMNRTVQTLGLPAGNANKKMERGAHTVTALAYSPDSQIIAVGLFNQIHLWAPQSGASLADLNGSKDDIIQLIFTPDQLELLSLSKDGIIRIWGIP